MITFMYIYKVDKTGKSEAKISCISHSPISVGQLSKSTAELVTVGESDKSLNK